MRGSGEAVSGRSAVAGRRRPSARRRQRMLLGGRSRRQAVRALIEAHGAEFRRLLRQAYGAHPDGPRTNAYYGRVRTEAVRALICANQGEYERLRATGYRVEEIKAQPRPVQSPLLLLVPSPCQERISQRRKRVAGMAAVGATAGEIARDVGVDVRTVHRDRAAIGLSRGARRKEAS